MTAGKTVKLATSAIIAAMVPAITAADEIKVNVVNGHPPVFLWVKELTDIFIPAVNKALEGTGHSIAWTESYGGTLAAVGGELEALGDGLAEVGIVPTVFEPTELPLQNVTYFTPFSTPDANVVMTTMEGLYDTVPAMRQSWESHDLEYLGGGFTLDNYALLTTFPVTSIDDLKGHKIAAPGAAVNWLGGTGAVGVSGNLTTYYSDLQTGVFDGVIVFPTAAAPAKLAEVAPYVILTDFGAQYAGTMVANKPWFDAQPAEVQQALTTGAKAYTAAYLQEQNKRVAAAMEAMKAAGATVTELSPVEKQRWADALPPIATTWEQAAIGAGLPGNEVLDAYMKGLTGAGATPLRNWAAR